MSFANVTFFGVGAYGVSLPLYSVGTNWSALVIEFIAAAARALAIGLFSLRVQPIFFAMRRRRSLTPFNVFASQPSGRPWRGRPLRFPEALQLGPNLVKDKALGVVITGKI